MRFEELASHDAVGAMLAHGHRIGPATMLKKGHVVTAEDARALVAAGVLRVSAARLEDGDLDENEAARRIAQAVAGPNVTVARAATGRANLFAAARGVVVAARERIDALNEVDEAITLATLLPYAVVENGAMVATVKIIPFAVPASLVERAVAASPVLDVAPFTAKRAGLVLTTLPGVREAQLAQGSRSQHRRMAYLGGSIARELRVPHDEASVAEALRTLLDEKLDLVMVLGASAIVDRLDVVPVAIERAGGVIEHLGMPVDPGNLLLLGRHGTTPILGVPGCARSLKRSGFDAVLERIAADLPVGRAEIVRLGAGGLLAEVSRPAPRQAESPGVSSPRVAAIVLAAGLSRRMGGANKLLAPIDGVPIVARTVDALLASRAAPVLVVVGHEADRVRAALAGREVVFVPNAAYEEGLGASLRAGVEALTADVHGALVALGDMPWVKPAHVDALVAAFDPSGPHTICVPVHDRKRGHPVLWSRRHFPEMKKLGGDVGARALLEQHAGAVLAVDVDDAAVHLDVDTPSMLAAALRRPV
ncbi:MAG: 4-diphosphocytidyl-2C-methyl-D-erythritol kinase [Labilithrix sp.]|nr:4-diphosphocytidyl-2C-methyl-D-erythritol kinase [Labilithrix sp.]